MGLSRSKVLGGLALVTSVTAALASHAQTPPRVAPKNTPLIQPQQVQPLQMQQISVSPDLKAALASKRAYDPRAMPPITYANNVPSLRTQKGRTYQLEPIGTGPVPPAANVAKVLPKELEPYKAHIESPYIIGKRVIKLFDVGWSNLSKQTPVKDQGPRGTCTAFASVGALEAQGVRKGKVRDLSENHAFQIFMIENESQCTMGGGFITWKTGPILTDRGVCTEALMPYTSTCPDSIPVACNSAANARFTNTAHFYTPTYGGTGALRADNTNLLEAALKSGADIVYGLSVAGSDWSNGNVGGTGDGIIDVQQVGGNPAPSVGGHAMLIVGYNRLKNYFIVKNSWGSDWGHDGYAWISYEYIQTYGKYGYAVYNAAIP